MTATMRRLLTVGILGLIPGVAMAADGTAVLAGTGVGVLICVAAVVAARPFGLALSAFAGAMASFYLAYEHTQTGTAICDISSAISCTAVNTSEYSKMMGIPVALFGLGYFLAMSWLAFRYAFQQKAGALGLLQLGAVLGVGFDIYLGFRMFQIGSLCPFCASTYVMNLLLLVGSSLERRGKEINLVGALQTDGSTAVVLGLVGLVVGIAATGSGSSGSSHGTKAASNGPVTADDLKGTYEMAAGPIHYEPNDPMKGNPDGKYILVEWADFQCPHCKLMFPELKKVVEENPDVQLHYKNYPISQNCNHFVEWEGHKDACNAAAAGVCANAQNAFWPLAEKMFENQEYLGKDDIRFMVSQVGLNATAFEACMGDPATAAAVKEDVEAGGLANIHGTPAIFLKGPFGDQWVTVKGGREAINNILKVARAGGSLPPPPPPSPDQ